jgi:hypothetical protein
MMSSGIRRATARRVRRSTANHPPRVADERGDLGTRLRDLRNRIGGTMEFTQPDMESAQSASSFSKATLVGIVLVTVGGVVGACGVGISGAALIRGFRAWLRAQQPITGSVKPRAVPAKTASSVRGSSVQKEVPTPSVSR